MTAPRLAALCCVGDFTRQRNMPPYRLALST